MIKLPKPRLRAKLNPLRRVGMIFLAVAIATLAATTFWLSLRQILPSLRKAPLCPDCNIILISIDTLRPDHLGIYGYNRPTSPNIDRFFGSSTVFLNHFSQSSITLPSHMSIITSLYPQKHGAMVLYSPPIEASVKTLPQILKENGYTTIGLHNGGLYLEPQFGFARGFDYYGGEGLELKAIFEALDKAKMGQKLFLFLHPENPHDPYVVPESYAKRFTNPNYAGKIDSEPASLANASTFDEARELFWSKVDKNDPRDIAHLVDLYDAKIAQADEFLGKVFTYLQQNRLFDNSIIILTSDHGEEFGEHGGFLHIRLYDETIKVPLLLKLPGQEKRLPLSPLTQNIDLAPTILELVGVTAEANFSGQSLVPATTGQAQEVNQYIIAQWTATTAIRTREWKLILESGKARELYHLGQDPAEKINLIGRFPVQAQELEKKLLAVLGEVRFDYSVPPGVELEEETRKKLIEEGYF